MRNEKSQFNNIGISSELDMPRIRHLMKIGLATGVMALIGDILLGYGASDAAVSGIPATFARYLTVSDRRIFWSAILGLIGIPHITLLCQWLSLTLNVNRDRFLGGQRLTTSTFTAVRRKGSNFLLCLPLN